MTTASGSAPVMNKGEGIEEGKSGPTHTIDDDTEVLV
jgi:hypothetical protein